MRHSQHWYFPQFRCNMRKISAKHYRRAKLIADKISGLPNDFFIGVSFGTYDPIFFIGAASATVCDNSMRGSIVGLRHSDFFIGPKVSAHEPIRFSLRILSTTKIGPCSLGISG